MWSSYSPCQHHPSVRQLESGSAFWKASIRILIKEKDLGGFEQEKKTGIGTRNILLLFFNFMRFGKLFVIKIPENFQFYPLDPDPYLNGAQMRTWIRIRNIMCSNPNLTGADPGSFFSDPACHLIFDRSPIFR